MQPSQQEGHGYTCITYAVKEASMHTDVPYLFPRTNACRSFTCLDGLWRMQFDPQGLGGNAGWE